MQLLLMSLSMLLPIGSPHGADAYRSLVPQSNYRTAEVEWTMSAYGDINDGLVERFRTHVVGESILQSNFGDENGFHEYELLNSLPEDWKDRDLAEFTYPREVSAGTWNTLRHEGQVWDLPHVHEPVVGMVGPEGHSTLRNPLDFRLVGLSAAWDTRASNPLKLRPDLAEGLEAANYTDGRDGNLRTVTATYNEKRLTWWFDDRRGGQPVRAMVERGQEVYWSETELMEVEGRWFPSAVRFYTGYLDQPYRILEVTKATFDEPWHKQKLGPEDLGAGYGTQFNNREDSEFYFWSGDDLMPRDQFWVLAYAFGIRFDEAVLRGRARGSGMTPEEYNGRIFEEKHVERALAVMRQQHLEEHKGEPYWVTAAKVKEKDAWDVFVEEFIEKHDPTDKAAERAGKILEAAKKLRNANRFRLKNAERENERRLIDRYKEREELIYKERLVAPLEELARSEAAKKEEAKPEGQ